jgi:hypothetical protein
MSWGGSSDLVVRDQKTGTVVFHVVGQQYDYDADQRRLDIRAGRLVVSPELARELARPSEAGAVAGTISLFASMRAIEAAKLVEGEVQSHRLPAGGFAGSVPGPDVIVGDLSGLQQFGGSSGTQVGLAVGTDSCNAGTVDLNWFALPSNDHPVIPQNLYRVSGGATNDERFEQIGQSSVKHAFTALTQNLCGFGCNGVGGTRLGSGCSDPYTASLNAGPNLGSRAWINPFTGAYPRGDSATPPNNHTGHAHVGPSHRILVEIADLNTTLNPGATYWAEAQYITPHEYAWCQANPTQCNMHNNVSHRKYTVIGTTSPFNFSPAGTTVRMTPAISEWPGATLTTIKPDASSDGTGIVAYKVTHPSAGVWHYEYAVYNQNLERGIQSFKVPVSPGVNVTNIGFHAPPQHPGWTADGTVGDAGYSSAPWTVTQTATDITWSSETFATNPNANAIRWGTLYNFRFDASVPPARAPVTIGLFKPSLATELVVDDVLVPLGAVARHVQPDGRTPTFVPPITVPLHGSRTNPACLVEAEPALVGHDWRAALADEQVRASLLFLSLHGPTEGTFNRMGEVLIRPPVIALESGVLAFPIPNDARLVGLGFSAQAAVRTPTGWRLTNALDVTIGGAR